MLRDEEVSASDEARSYRQASFKDRVAMASAGSAMHFLMAFILLFAHFAFFDQADPDVWSVESVVPGSAAAEAGMASGDRVLSVDGAKVGGQEDLSDEVRARPGETVPIVVERDGKTLDLTATLGTRASVIGTVGEDLSLFHRRPSGRQGLRRAWRQGGPQRDAVITEINDVPINSAVDLKAATKAAAGGVLEIDYVADGETRTQSTYLKLGKAVAATEPEGMIGTTSGYAEVGKNPVEAAGASVTTFWQLSRDSVTGLVTVLNPANLVDFLVGRPPPGPPAATCRTSRPGCDRPPGEHGAGRNRSDEPDRPPRSPPGLPRWTGGNCCCCSPCSTSSSGCSTWCPCCRSTGAHRHRLLRAHPRS
jgi:membrane-associated protease RseP (regulator of RpoE activity)